MGGDVSFQGLPSAGPSCPYAPHCVVNSNPPPPATHTQSHGVDASTGIRLLILPSVSILWEGKFQAMRTYVFSSKISPRLPIHWWFWPGPFFFVVIETDCYSHLRALCTFTCWPLASMFAYLFAAWRLAFLVHFFQCWCLFSTTMLPRILFSSGSVPSLLQPLA